MSITIQILSLRPLKIPTTTNLIPPPCTKIEPPPTRLVRFGNAQNCPLVTCTPGEIGVCPVKVVAIPDFARVEYALFVDSLLSASAEDDGAWSVGAAGFSNHVFVACTCSLMHVCGLICQDI